MNKKELRKVEFYVDEIGQHMGSTVDKKGFVIGFFHGWGNTISYNDSNDRFPVMYGIVEREDNGKVEMIAPDKLKFIN